MSPLVVLALVLALIGLLFAGAGLAALFRLRPLRALTRLLASALLFSLGAGFALLAVGVQGYRALTHEEVAAQVSVTPLGPQRFRATFRFADGSAGVFDLAGDEVYVDAHILKWHPWANVLGLHTGYELGRVAGRYVSIEQEKAAPRTIHALAPERPVDVFALSRRYARLAFFVDAEYGSATFVPANEPKELELRVSTTGLMFRPRPR